MQPPNPTKEIYEAELLDVLKPHLDESWQQWVIENIKRRVIIQDIIKVLGENNHHQAAKALLNITMPTIKTPVINLDKNHLLLGDGTKVNIVFSCQTPYVVVLDNFLSLDECQAFIELADSKFEHARVVDEASGEFVQHKNRTSMNASFQRDESAFIQKIESRIAETINWQNECTEGMQVLRYKEGGEYKAHFDFFNPTTDGGKKNMQKGGQRVGTFLMYLSDVESGGATRFPAMNFEVRPHAGMALYFSNLLPNGIPDEQTLHASIPVHEGIKYLATKWVRLSPYI